MFNLHLHMIAGMAKPRLTSHMRLFELLNEALLSHVVFVYTDVL